MKLPLSGVRLLGMAPWLPGLNCNMLLADLGADVILIEHPSGKERLERAPGFLDIINRNKKSLTLDLKSAKGREVFNKLVAKSDIFMEGFRPGTTRRLGIDYNGLKEINPKIIYCSISGYGQDGPYRDYPAHNNTYMGLSGMAQTFEDSPVICNPYVPVADLIGSMFAVISILAALRVRDNTGEGQYIDVSLTDCAVSSMSSVLGILFATGGSQYPTIMPATGFYKAKDEKYLSLSVGATDHLWRNLCYTVGMDDFAGMSRQEREKKIEELDAILQELIDSRTREEWLELFHRADVPCGSVHTLSGLSSDPHIRHRKLMVEIEDKSGKKVKQVAYPVKFSQTTVEIRKLAPTLGEDTEQILEELGYSENEIKELRNEKAI